MKSIKTTYYLGLGLSLAVAIWHFFVPSMFGWHTYIPAEYEALHVAIDWVNVCFSLLLGSQSLLLILWGEKFFSGNREVFTVYGALTFVWIVRLGLAIFDPWPLTPLAWPGYLQFGVTVLILGLLLVPLIKGWAANRAK